MILTKHIYLLELGIGEYRMIKIMLKRTMEIGSGERANRAVDPFRMG